MAVLAIVTSSPASVEGGHLVIARSLVAAARDAGHEAHLVVTPDHGFGRQGSTYLATWRTDVRTIDERRVDQVVSLRYPSYAVRHPAHVCWLNHTMREYYDLWPRFAASISMRARVKERVRRLLLHEADRWLLKRNVTEVVAQSGTVQRRLDADLGVRAEVLLPPAPPRPYRCEIYSDYIFAVSRLTPLKRIDLLVRALAEPAARHVRAVVAGEGESRAELEQLAADLHVEHRITFLGRIDEAALLGHLARCRAVCFPPMEEDYGFVTVEAFASHKAVVTCHDSGGPLDLVVDGETGLVCDPIPASLAAAFARLLEDPRLAERLGCQAGARAARLAWPDAVKRLVIV
jgi:glycosyltransferase involved in cell wall biosynthesis